VLETQCCGLSDVLVDTAIQSVSATHRQGRLHVPAQKADFCPLGTCGQVT
jgi:hypothetical protein